MVISFCPDRELPPASGSISRSTKSRKPLLSSRHAALSPEIPPPTMTTGTLIACLGVNAGYGPAVVAEREPVIHKTTGDTAVRFRVQPNESGAQETAAVHQCAMSFHSRS